MGNLEESFGVAESVFHFPAVERSPQASVIFGGVAVTGGGDGDRVV